MAHWESHGPQDQPADWFCGYVLRRGTDLVSPDHLKKHSGNCCFGLGQRRLQGGLWMERHQRALLSRTLVFSDLSKVNNV